MATSSPNHFTLALLNVEGLNRTFDYVRLPDLINVLVQRYEINLLGVCDTRLDDTVSREEITFEGFKVRRNDGPRNEGGVALYHRTVRVVRKDRNPTVNIIWFELNLPNMKPILVGCCYRPADAETDLLNEICQIMKDVSRQRGKKYIFLMGTFNVDWNQESDEKNRLQRAANESGLYQIADVGRGPTNRQPCMDHIYTNIPHLCILKNPISVEFSDHKLHIVRVTSALNEEDQFVSAVANIRLHDH